MQTWIMLRKRRKDGVGRKREIWQKKEEKKQGSYFCY